MPPMDHGDVSTVRCTYIEIPQAKSTLGVVLSKPSWMWGCEMGANDKGVVGGNEAVHSVMSSELGSEERLLGMDLLRLALERGPTAHEAALVCIELLEAHGQGGGCAEDDASWTYENGFLFADAGEAYVLETAGVRCWALERVPPGTWRNISNGLSIRTNIHSHSAGLREMCRDRGWWDGASDFDWKRCLGVGGRTHASLAVSGRERAGASHLARMQRDAASGALRPDDAQAWLGAMMGVLRDDCSGICFRDVHGFCSTGSQVSWISNAPHGGSQHLFTGASDPVYTSYKHFTFATAPKGATTHGTRELWDAWRHMALQGISPDSELRVEVARIEKASLDHSNIIAPGGVAAQNRPDFAAAVAAELKAVQEMAKRAQEH